MGAMDAHKVEQQGQRDDRNERLRKTKPFALELPLHDKDTEALRWNLATYVQCAGAISGQYRRSGRWCTAEKASVRGSRRPPRPATAGPISIPTKDIAGEGVKISASVSLQERIPRGGVFAETA